MAHGLENIDWTAPWLAPYRLRGEAVASAVAQGAAVCDALNHAVSDALNDAAGAPVRFVAQSELPAGRAYEDHIFHSAACPTRDGPTIFSTACAGCTCL